MPATNYTPIQFYRSTTSGNVPSAANLSPGELALNIADNDMTMYFENASGVVKRFFNNPAELKYPTADGTSGQVIVTDGSGNLSFATPAGGALTNNTRQAVTSSATTTINLNSGNVIDLTMAANITTLSFTNVPASGTPILIQIVVKNAASGTAYTITWPNSVYWSGQYSATTVSTVQTAPTLATGANGITVIGLLTTDGGTKWRGWVEGTVPGGVAPSLYSWGADGQGELGQSNTANKSSPVQVGALADWALISAGNYFCTAIKTDGTLWSWGQGTFGKLGHNNTAYKSSPVQVGALTNWSSISAGENACMAIKTDGTLWSWGANGNGQLGQNDTVVRSSPVQVGALTNWSSVSPRNSFCIAVKTDGTLWSWGFNGQGRLGQNLAYTANVSSPVQVGALTTWSKVSAGNAFCAAIKTDGTLWSWGYANVGQLGQNNTTNRSSPVQVGALTNWSSVSAGEQLCTAIKTDGTLWSWGYRGSGQLGQNDNANKSSPVQVGALTNWSSISAANAFCTAVKTDGTLWSWGINTNGQLGQNNTANLSSPVQIGALTGWLSTSSGINFSVARLGITVNPA
jgi:alpha-tubulin suppressor-like RCC1 family protein